MATEPRLEGTRYVVKALLGEGSQGATYAAHDTETGRDVAIKRFDVRGARSWKDVELAERETRVLATLDHPLVPRYIEHFEKDGALYLVMDLVEGETLEAIRKRQGALPEAEVRRLLACVDGALTYLHGRGSPVVHRDVKPSNVVRRADGTYVLVDFGAVSEQLFRRGSSTIVGTMGFMAPEQLQGRALPASDVYAVGATALSALTGEDPENLPHKGLRVDVARALEGRASPEMIGALGRMLEPDPDLRATSIRAALDGGAPATGVHADALATAARDERASEDATVKSLRNLLWSLWGIAWVPVPTLLGAVYHRPQLIPVVMFGWLALNVLAGWHKGALLRALVRQWRAENASRAGAAQGSGAARRRVAPVPAPPPPQVRVHTSDLGPDDEVARTEVQVAEASRAKARLPR